jgi:hypothetical protein
MPGSRHILASVGSRPRKNWIAALALVACESQPKVATEYRQDLATLCDVVELSDAKQAPSEERSLIIAMWLGPHIKTKEAHDFLARIQPLTGEIKARALEEEARRVGLGGCALAAEWHSAQQ